MRDELIYGIHVVKTLLQKHPERILEIFLSEARTRQALGPLLEEASKFNVSVQMVTKNKLDQWFKDANHQGIAARIRPNTVHTEHDFDDFIKTLPAPYFFLILDEIQDPHNLGACLRVAEAAGVQAVIFPQERSCGITPAVRKVASGAAEILPLVQVRNLANFLQKLKLGPFIKIIGTTGEANQSLYNTSLNDSVALILGAEHSGLRTLTQKHCDELVSIPMHGVVESLNVSVAAGVCLFEVVRQRAYARNSY